MATHEELAKFSLTEFAEDIAAIRETLEALDERVSGFDTYTRGQLQQLTGTVNQMCDALRQPRQEATDEAP